MRQQILHLIHTCTLRRGWGGASLIWLGVFAGCLAWQVLLAGSSDALANGSESVEAVALPLPTASTQSSPRTCEVHWRKIMVLPMTGYKKVLLGVLFSAALFVVAAASTSHQYPPPGKLVDLGDRRLHIHCMGKGGPTVVVENGTGDFSFDWALVQPAVARFTRICTYDRAGYAWSDAGPKPRTLAQIALELRTGLQKLGVRGPYVLVGQSYGGFPVRAFARLYRADVAGLVLVDTNHEDSRVRIGSKAVRLREMARGREIPPPRMRLLPSELPPTNETRQPLPASATLLPPLDKLPAKAQAMRLWAMTQPAYEDAGQNEREWAEEEVAQMYAHKGKPAYRLGDLPLIVLTRTSGGYSEGLGLPAAELERERLALQADLARLSTNSLHFVAQNSGHNIHLEAPQLVIGAIRQVVTAARHHTRLSQAGKRLRNEK